MINKLRLKKLNNRQFKLLGIITLLLILPLIIIAGYQIQDTRSRAATPDQLELEQGVTSGNVQKLSDNTASGGQFVRLASTNSTPSPTPTGSTTPTIPANAIYVPDSWDSTGTSDVSTQLQSLINNAPANSTLVFKSGGRYRLDKGIWIDNKNNLTLEGNGATLNLRTNDLWISLHISNSTGTIIRNLTLEGTNNGNSSNEGLNSHAIGVLSSDDTLIDNVDIKNVWADCLFTRHYHGQNGDWSNNLTFKNSSCVRNGRTGITLTGVNNLRVENNYFDQIAFHLFNSEPGEPHEGANGVLIKDNKVGSYGVMDIDDPWFFASCDAQWNSGDSTVSNVTITGNNISGNPITWKGNPGQIKALHIVICGNTGIRENYTVTNNTAASAIVGPSMYFKYVKGLTVTGNIQPLTSGTLVDYTGSTNVIVNSNNTSL
jgi:hypothetical protein